MATDRKRVRGTQGNRPASMDAGQMIVRCIFGGQVQEKAEARGMRPWCDEHCVDGKRVECYWKLKELGILSK